MSLRRYRGLPIIDHKTYLDRFNIHLRKKLKKFIEQGTTTSFNADDYLWNNIEDIMEEGVGFTKGGRSPSFAR